MVKIPELSVVVPVYGQFDLARACISVQSILSQRDLDYEVIVSEQGESRKFPEMSGVRYIFKYHKPRPDLSDFNPGNVRNKAVALARGKFVYTNDADVVFLEPHYLAKSVGAMKNNLDRILYRPFMRRLPLDEFSEFERRVREEEGIQYTFNNIDWDGRNQSLIWGENVFNELRRYKSSL